MSPSLKVRPPFAWLGRHNAAVSLIGVVGIGAFLRFFQLTALPPGLYSGAAQIGTQALDLLERGWFPGLTAADGYAPLWIWLQAASIKLLGHTDLALRLWPALLGTLAVLTTWLWVRSWFGLRTAWFASLFVAVTPWAVTLSRNGLAAALMPLLVTLTLWAATLAWRTKRTLGYLPLALALTLDLLSGPLGWLIAATTLAVGLAQLLRANQLLSLNRPRIIGAGVLAAGLALFGWLLIASYGALKSLPQVAGLVSGPAALGRNIVRTLLMFNVTGDENYRHNLPAEPLLNAFVGLMLIAGLLVAVSRLHERKYRIFFVYLLVLMLPAFLGVSGVPNAAYAAAALPLVLTLAAIGTSYMLDLWYKTFPINSAARATGQIAILILIGLTVVQGYTQYFRAWAGSSEVYAAYNEGATQMAHYLSTDNFTGLRYIVAPPDEQAVVAYLDHKQAAYSAIQAKDLEALPVATTGREFIIAANSRDDAVKELKLKFPGGVLRPHYSTFNQAEIFYTYEVTKK